MNLLIAEEVSRFQIVELAFLLPHLVTPNLQSLRWDYSQEPVSYPAWLVADFQQNDMGIFYSEHGHGTHDHWGAIQISQKQFGMG